MTNYSLLLSEAVLQGLEAPSLVLSHARSVLTIFVRLLFVLMVFRGPRSSGPASSLFLPLSKGKVRWACSPAPQCLGDGLRAVQEVASSSFHRIPGLSCTIPQCISMLCHTQLQLSGLPLACCWNFYSFANQKISGCVIENIILIGFAELTSLGLHLPVAPLAGYRSWLPHPGPEGQEPESQPCLRCWKPRDLRIRGQFHWPAL